MIDRHENPHNKKNFRPMPKWFENLANAASGDNCKRGPAQRKALEGLGGVLSIIMGGAMIIGMTVAFGVWGLAVIGIILFTGMLTGRKE